MTPQELALDVLAQWYHAPEPQECNEDNDCGTGCCRQIGTHVRKCYPDSDNSCHLRWITLPPTSLAKWDLLSDESRFTGNFGQDVIASRIQEAWKSGDATVYRLANGQYWEEQSVLSKSTLKAGDDVLIAPGEVMFTLVAIGTTEARFARQVPLVLDTVLSGPATNLSTDGIYQLDNGGYWRVFGMTMMSDRRVLLTTPNNVDFWIYTAGEAENHADPSTVFADGEATATNSGFSVDDGTARAYVIDNEKPVPTGQHVIVYNLTFYDDRKDDNRSAPYCWYEGLGYSLGPWVSSVQ